MIFFSNSTFNICTVKQVIKLENFTIVHFFNEEIILILILRIGEYAIFNATCFKLLQPNLTQPNPSEQRYYNLNIVKFLF